MFCTDSCWANIDFFFLGFIVVFELTDSESEPLGKQGCTMQQTPRRAFPAPAPQQVTVPNGGAEIQSTGHHTGYHVPPRPSLLQQATSCWFEGNKP